MNNGLAEMIEIIKENDYYQVFFNEDKPIIVYDDHRFIVPILWLAKKNNVITCPINLVYFDRHSDALDLAEKVRKIDLINKANSFSDVFKIVKKELRQLDDDWLRTLMYLEIVKDAVVIGNNEFRGYDQFEAQDRNGLERNAHKLESISSLEGAFDYQGSLSDLARHSELSSVWDIMGWQNERGVGFIMRDAPILLDFDLDCFAFQWRGRSYAWRDDFYPLEFDIVSGYSSARGWSGKSFLLQLIQRAPFVTIAKEPNCCGGKKESDHILENLSNMFFNGELK